MNKYISDLYVDKINKTIENYLIDENNVQNDKKFAFEIKKILSPICETFRNFDVISFIEMSFYRQWYQLIIKKNNEKEINILLHKRNYFNSILIEIYKIYNLKNKYVFMEPFLNKFESNVTYDETFIDYPFFHNDFEEVKPKKQINYKKIFVSTIKSLIIYILGLISAIIILF